jgi:anti-sigma factor RsiW
MTVDVEQLSCQELVELVTDYLEGALSAEETDRFEGHIARCTGCAAYLEQIRQTIALTGRLTPESLSAEAERELLHAFRGWRKR